MNLINAGRLLGVLGKVRGVLSGLEGFLLFDHVKGEVLHIFEVALGVEGLRGAKALASERLVIIILHELREARLVVLFIIFLRFVFAFLRSNRLKVSLRIVISCSNISFFIINSLIYLSQQTLYKLMLWLTIKPKELHDYSININCFFLCL